MDTDTNINFSIGVIRKVGNMYVIFSKKGKRLGSFKTREAAIKRLRAIEFFKRSKGTDIVDENFDLITAEELIGEYNFSEAQKVDMPKIREFIRLRQTDPGKYKEFRTIDIDKKKGIKAVLGISGEGKNRTSEIQSYLFDKEKWSAKEAKDWVKNHKQES